MLAGCWPRVQSRDSGFESLRLHNQTQKRTGELETRSEELSRLTRQLTLAEHRERKRLVDLLHDDLQQLLSGAKLHLEMLGKKMAGPGFDPGKDPGADKDGGADDA